MRAIRLGALEILETPVNGSVLVKHILRAVELDAANREKAQIRKQVEAQLNQLSDREWQVLRHVVQGLASKQIAAKLHISQKTVERHRAHIIEKMGARSTADVIRIVVAARGTF